MAAQKVPIVAFHSVADEHAHLFRHLSLPVDVFERLLGFLQREGYTTVTLYEVYAHLKSGDPLPPRALALTFDDGYLDNWVFAFPLLKKYGMKATLFVVPELVDPRDIVRPTLDDADGQRLRRDMKWWGYASWPELRVMQASGLVDIQSHTTTHTWHFVSDTIVDFHHPGDEYFWMCWNRDPSTKSGWLTATCGPEVPWGTPVYEFAPALLGPRYLDDRDLARHVSGYVSDHGGADFFDPHDWRRELDEVVASYRRCHSSGGRYETESEYFARLAEELAESKKTIADQLDKPVDFLCWPCGDYTPLLQRFAIDECNYLATVNVSKTTNRYGDDPTELHRIVFRQDYEGPFRSLLTALHFRGAVGYHSGSTAAYPLAPLTRRLMLLDELFKSR